MKRCRKCGKENAEEMNFCLECGEALPAAASSAADTADLSNAETIAGGLPEPVTEEYEKTTAEGRRSAFGASPGPTVASFRPGPETSSGSNLKMLLLAGAGLAVPVLLIGAVAVGLFVYALRKQPSPPPARPLAERTPGTDSEPAGEVPPTPYPEAPLPPDETSPPPSDEDVITFPTPTAPTKSATFRVETVSGWQLSKIETVPAEHFRIRVSGKVDLAGIARGVTAAGVEGHEDRRIVSDQPTGALLMRTHYPDGRHSNLQPVALGEYWQNYEDETGRIEFLINDTRAAEASGSFVITFTMEDGPPSEE